MRGVAALGWDSYQRLHRKINNLNLIKLFEVDIHFWNDWAIYIYLYIYHNRQFFLCLQRILVEYLGRGWPEVIAVLLEKLLWVDWRSHLGGRLGRQTQIRSHFIPLHYYCSISLIQMLSTSKIYFHSLKSRILHAFYENWWRKTEIFNNFTRY